MKKYVIDTSVAVKWFSRIEEDTDNALRLRQQILEGECLIVVPDLLIYELANALRHNPNFTKKDTKSALDSLFNMSLEIKKPDVSIINLAVDIAFEFDVTVYDAYFMALSRFEKVPFVTADYRFIGRIKSFKKVIKLSDYG